MGWNDDVYVHKALKFNHWLFEYTKQGDTLEKASLKALYRAESGNFNSIWKSPIRIFPYNNDTLNYKLNKK
jgi:hypothetical protein